MISRQSSAAVRAWLARFSLTDQIQHVAARNYQPGHPKTIRHLLDDVLRSLPAKPQGCALITATANTLEVARDIGVHSIGYVPTTDESDHLSAAGADSVV